MSNMQTYFNEALKVEIRAVTVENTVWFCGADVAKGLGYANTTEAVKAHCKSPKTWAELQTLQITGSALEGSFQPQTKFIKRNDVARLAARSQLPSADAFESWIFDEVLESVFETGTYGLQQLSEEQVAIMYLDSVRAKNAAIAHANQLALEVAERSTRLAEGSHMTMRQIRDTFPWMSKCDWRELREISKELGHEILSYGTDGATSQSQPAMYHREVCYDYVLHLWNTSAQYRPWKLKGHQHPAIFFGVELPECDEE